MALLDLYDWAIPSKSEFLSRFSHNEGQYNQALRFWDGLEDVGLVLVIVCLFCSIFPAVFYYTGFNNMSGRHYKPKYWWIFFGIVFLFVLVFSFGGEYFLIGSNLSKMDGATSMLIKLASVNALYAAMVYLIISFVWCNFLSTNAYRYLKF